MAIDVDQLRNGLQAYRGSLARHLARLSHDFENVHEAWARLDQEYDGQSAEEFRRHWGATAQWFEQYMTAVKSMIATLEERSEHLREL